MRTLWCGILLLLAGVAAAQHFERVTEGPMVNDGGDSRAVNWIDIDGDGDLDLFVTNGAQGGENNFLYRSEGSAFVRVTGEPIVQDHAPSDGSTWGDLDNDGDADCFVANWYNVDNLLYRNHGNGSFTQITDSPAATDGGYSESGSWADYDADGWLDLVVANSAGTNHTNFVYHNNGDGTLARVTEGVVATASAASRAPLWADYDNDGDVDLYMANESGQNDFLYRNDGGSFAQIADGPVVSSGGSTMSASWGDYDNDGDLDLFAANAGNSGTNCNQNDHLFRNDGAGVFTRITEGDVVQSGGCSFGSLWGDFDNDADLDLYVTNGWRSAGNANFVFWNGGDGTFTRETAEAIATDSGWCYGAAAADYDRDGDLDIMVADWTPTGSHHNRLYRNLAQASGNHWLVMRLAGSTSNRSAIGARVRVKATVNGQAVWQLREVSGQSGYCGQTLEQHVGLGDAQAVDSLWVRWPSGLIEVYTGVTANQLITLTEGGGYVGTEPIRPAPVRKHSLLEGYPNPFNPAVEIRFELAAAGRVELAVFDLTGRRVNTLLDEVRAAGRHEAVWNGQDARGRAVATGMYLCRLQAGEQRAVLKLLKIG